MTTGSSCVATCGVAGYTYSGTSGPQSFECLATSEFQGTNPICSPRPCENLTLAEAFVHDCRGMVFQEACSVTCAEGYEQSGAPSQYLCGQTGNIEGTLPSCTAKPCSNTVPAAYISTCNGITTDGTCTVSCQEGMIPNSAVMTCHATGALVGTLPECLPAKCSLTPSLQATSIAHNCENVSFGQSCSVSCASGFKLAQGLPKKTLKR